MNLFTGPREPHETRAKPAFSYHHVVSFEETNVVGNVYFARHVAWQGRCREAFLKRYVPDILGMIARDLRLVTIRVSCEYYQELHAFDEVEIRMSLAFLRQHRIGLDFDIIAQHSRQTIHAARGFQEIGCMRATEKALFPIAPPAALAAALRQYAVNQFDIGATEPENLRVTPISLVSGSGRERPA